MATLREAYINGLPEALSLFSNPLGSLNTTPPAAAPWNPELVSAIRAFNDDLGHTVSFEGNEAVVITGQQPAIFGGPLYSVYKAITTIKLASRIAETHGVPCIPVYWVGSEDHDFDEAATTYYPTRKHETRSLSYQQPADQAGCAMHETRLTSEIHGLIDEMADAVVSSEFGEEIRTFLHDSADEATSLSDWSTRCLARLFRGTPLVFFAPHLIEARRCTTQIIEKAIRNPLEVTHRVNDGADALEALGYTAQVVKNDNECAFFLEIDARRQKVIFDSGQFQLPEIGQAFSEAELLARLQDTPECFSPNVALRCVIQQALFPVAAYIAGPGELSYWGQFKGVFDFFALPMPVVYPRAEAVLTTIKNNKLMAKYGLTVTDLYVQRETLIESALRNVSQSPALTLTQSSRVELERLLQDLNEGLERDTPVAASMVATLTADVSRKLDRLESVILQSDTQKNETVTGHIERLSECLAPRRKPQERLHTIYGYLFEHGWGLMDTLLREIEIESFDLNEVEL